MVFQIFKNHRKKLSYLRKIKKYRKNSCFEFFKYFFPFTFEVNIFQSYIINNNKEFQDILDL